MADLQWNKNAPFEGGHLRGYLGQNPNTESYSRLGVPHLADDEPGTDPLPWNFQETVARFVALSGQNPAGEGDTYKQSIQFVGTFKGRTFSLYDYKGDRQIHIGGTNGLDVRGLQAALIAALLTVKPAPYQATERYDEERVHSWPA